MAPELGEALAHGEGVGDRRAAGRGPGGRTVARGIGRVDEIGDRSALHAQEEFRRDLGFEGRARDRLHRHRDEPAASGFPIGQGDHGHRVVIGDLGAHRHRLVFGDRPRDRAVEHLGGRDRLGGRGVGDHGEARAGIAHDVGALGGLVHAHAAREAAHRERRGGLQGPGIDDRQGPLPRVDHVDPGAPLLEVDPLGRLPHGQGRDDRVGGGVDDREAVGAVVGHVDAAAQGIDRHAPGVGADRHRLKEDAAGQVHHGHLVGSVQGHVGLAGERVVVHVLGVHGVGTQQHRLGERAAAGVHQGEGGLLVIGGRRVSLQDEELAARPAGLQLGDGAQAGRRPGQRTVAGVEHAQRTAHADEGLVELAEPDHAAGIAGRERQERGLPGRGAVPSDEAVGKARGDEGQGGTRIESQVFGRVAAQGDRAGGFLGGEVEHGDVAGMGIGREGEAAVQPHGQGRGSDPLAQDLQGLQGLGIQHLDLVGVGDGRVQAPAARVQGQGPGGREGPATGHDQRAGGARLQDPEPAVQVSHVEGLVARIQREAGGAGGGAEGDFLQHGEAVLVQGPDLPAVDASRTERQAEEEAVPIQDRIPAFAGEDGRPQVQAGLAEPGLRVVPAELLAINRFLRIVDVLHGEEAAGGGIDGQAVDYAVVADVDGLERRAAGGGERLHKAVVGQRVDPVPGDVEGDLLDGAQPFDGEHGLSGRHVHDHEVAAVDSRDPELVAQGIIGERVRLADPDAVAQSVGRGHLRRGPEEPGLGREQEGQDQSGHFLSGSRRVSTRLPSAPP